MKGVCVICYFIEHLLIFENFPRDVSIFPSRHIDLVLKIDPEVDVHFFNTKSKLVYRHEKVIIF